MQMLYNVWVSLAHEHEHKDIRTSRMAYLTQFLKPALLNPMINKMACTILLLICSHEVWVKVAYDISTSTRRKNLSVWHVLMLMSTQFSLAYTCACVFAYAYALVKTRLKML